jgi:hypothetical protein
MRCAPADGSGESIGRHAERQDRDGAWGHFKSPPDREQHIPRGRYGREMRWSR